MTMSSDKRKSIDSPKSLEAIVSQDILDRTLDVFGEHGKKRLAYYLKTRHGLSLDGREQKILLDRLQAALAELIGEQAADIVLGVIEAEFKVSSVTTQDHRAE